jgi:putative transposase
MRDSENAQIAVHIKASFARSRETYGSPRLTDDLRCNGIKTGRHRVAKLMRAFRICAKRPKRWKATTDSKHDMPRAPNLVARQWDAIATAPNRLWVSHLDVAGLGVPVRLSRRVLTQSSWMESL